MANLRKFRVTINGSPYEVEAAETSGNERLRPPVANTLPVPPVSSALADGDRPTARDIIHPQIVAVVTAAVTAYAEAAGADLAISRIGGPEGEIHMGVLRPASLWGYAAKLQAAMRSTRFRSAKRSR